MVLKRCSSERGEREKRFYGGGKGERRSEPRGESGRGEALSGSFLGREGPQKSTPYPGFKLELKKNTPQIQKFNLKCKSGDLELKLKFH